MLAVDALKYYRAIEKLEAQESLLEITLLDYSRNMGKKRRKEFFNSLKKKAGHKKDKTKLLKLDDLGKVFNGMINGR